ncbi:hypothetical protein [Nocardia flavorosea]|uniref:Uncharacterized protein n=1 Tax=Nocardia flavorosea TaxID=53429 RepID=A0A846YQH5_9NOCA|nr:hypothetical protein [Nocardia flavorosea]NKY61003.1 hypothetical protein [Nocardia flavorosea]
MPEIDPYEPFDPIGTPPEVYAAVSAEVSRVLELAPDEVFAELRPLLSRSLDESDAEEVRRLRRIALLAESLSKWWSEGGQFLVEDDGAAAR